MNIVTPSEMAEIDRLTIEDKGLNSLVLMENAARSILQHIPEGRVGVLVGPGNNGGDGLVLARALQERGREVSVLLLAEKLSPDSTVQEELAKNWGVRSYKFLPEHDLVRARKFFDSCDVLVDALFGTGLTRELAGRWKDIVELANEVDLHRLAVDIPSGVDGSNGQILGCAFRAHQTVTFGCLKRGHVTNPGALYCGVIHLTQPGFHPDVLQRFDRIQLFSQEWANRLLPKNWTTMHKGDNGKLLLVTGSETYPGAGALSALGALRAGAGLVSQSTTNKLKSALLQWAPEAIPLDRAYELDLTPFHAIVVGSGLGPEAGSLGVTVLEGSKVPTVVDADALDYVPSLEKARRGHLILTPHPGELSRLLGKPVSELEKDRIGFALHAADELGCVVCFKGSPTVCASPEGRAFVNSTGNPVLAQGGTGDLLAGMIGAYLAYGLPPLEAAAAASYLHGLAADLACQEIGPRGVTSQQISQFIPYAYCQSVGDQSADTVF